MICPKQTATVIGCQLRQNMRTSKLKRKRSGPWPPPGILDMLATYDAVSIMAIVYTLARNGHECGLDINSNLLGAATAPKSVGS